MRAGLALLVLATGLLILSADADDAAQEPAEPSPHENAPSSLDTRPQPPAPPVIPSLEEVQAGRAAITDFIPTQFDFRIAVIGDFTKEFITEAGPQKQIKTPLVLIDPSNGNVGVYAKNFPAKIVAHSTNGQWVIGVAPSSAVDGSSGSSQKESAVSLDLHSGEIKLLREFALHSKFQAVFDSQDNNVIYYCVNEPASENQIIKHNLRNNEEVPVPADGNRFYLYGLRTLEPEGIWVQDPGSVGSDPVLNLVDLDEGSVLKQVHFPGTQQIYAQPGGDTILATVQQSAEASLGYYQFSQETRPSYHQVPKLVLTRPAVKWLNTRMAIVAKESTTTRDRFLLIDLATGQARELFSAYFKISQWDIAPDDSALVFVAATKEAPVLYVVPMDARNTAINRVSLQGITNISWLGCLHPGKDEEGGSWLEKLLPFKL
jgi:hypothetical protein